MVIKSIEQFTISDCCAQLGLDSHHPEEGLKKIQPLGSRREIVERLLVLLEYMRRTLSIESVDSYLENIEEMDFIDIGLSSKWAKYNCGAHSELEYGNCFSWGEILTKEKYSRKFYTLSKKIGGKQTNIMILEMKSVLHHTILSFGNMGWIVRCLLNLIFQSCYLNVNGSFTMVIK